MSWLLQNVPLLVFVFIVISAVRAIKRARRASAEHTATHDETAEQRRVREIQERIRRIAAERRGDRPLIAPPPIPPSIERPSRPSVLRPQTAPPLDPFGGPLKRILGEFERRLQIPTPPPVVKEVSEGAKLERRQQVADEAQAAEEERMVAERRAAQQFTQQEEAARSETGLLATAQARLLEDLQDPQSLRRAFVLREVLGPPVGLR